MRKSISIMATTDPRPHEARLNFRLSPEIKDRIEKAAAIAGMSVSDFATSRLAAAADEVLTRHQKIVLSNQERDFFLALLAEPDPEPTLALREMTAQYNAWADTVRQDLEQGSGE